MSFTYLCLLISHFLSLSFYLSFFLSFFFLSVFWILRFMLSSIFWQSLSDSLSYFICFLWSLTYFFFFLISLFVCFSTISSVSLFALFIYLSLSQVRMRTPKKILLDEWVFNTLKNKACYIELFQTKLHMFCQVCWPWLESRTIWIPHSSIFVYHFCKHA